MFSTWGDIIGTLRHVQYIRGYHYEGGGILCVHRGMFSTSEKYHEYIGGCSVHQRDIMMHVREQLDKPFQFLLRTLMYS